MIRPVNSWSMGPLPHLFCCGASSLVWSNAMWNAMMVDKACCKSMAGSLGRSIEGKEGKSESRVSVYLERTKCCHFHDGSSQCNRTTYYAVFQLNCLRPGNGVHQPGSVIFRLFPVLFLFPFGPLWAIHQYPQDISKWEELKAETFIDSIFKQRHTHTHTQKSHIFLHVCVIWKNMRKETLSLPIFIIM